MQKITRMKAGLIHFCLSLALFSIIFLVLITLWYPESLFTASGGWQGLKIVAGIDVVLGPLLTLVIFNPTKSARELSTDLSVIAFFQTAALLWGIFTVHNQRPVAVVFWDDSFYTVTATDLNQYDYPLEQLQQFSPLNPPLIYAEKPTAIAGLEHLLSSMRESNVAPHHQTELYRPLAAHFANLAPYQLPLDNLLKKTPTLRPQLDDLLANTTHKENALQYYLLNAKYHNIILVFTPAGELIGHLTPPQKTLSEI